MKKLAMTLALVLSLAALPLVAEVPAQAADDAPACLQATDVETAIPATGLEGILGQEPEYKIKKNICSQVGPCDRWDSQYCNYSCQGYECCRAVILIPNSYCPPICA